MPETITVPRYDYKTQRFHPTEQVTLPLGEDIEREIARKYQGKLTGSRGMKRYLREHGVHVSSIFEKVLQLEPDELDSKSVRAILTNTDLRPFFAPMAEDGFRLGFQDVQTNWQDLLATTINTDQMSVQWYMLVGAKTSDDYTLKATGQGAMIPVATITVADKQIGLTKKTRGIEWTYEAEDAPVALAQIWLRVLGMRMGMSYWALIAARLVNGYLDDGSDAPTVVNTLTTGEITLADLRRGKSKLEDINGFPLTDVVINGDLRITLETQTVGTSGNLMLPNGSLADALGIPAENIHDNVNVSTDVIIFLNRGAALTRYVKNDFATEDATNVQKQVKATYASLTDQIVIGIPEARVVLDANW